MLDTSLGLSVPSGSQVGAMCCCESFYKLDRAVCACIIRKWRLIDGPVKNERSSEFQGLFHLLGQSDVQNLANEIAVCAVRPLR